MSASRAQGGTASGGAVSTVVNLPSGPSTIAGLAGAESLDLFSGQYHYSYPLDIPAAAGGWKPNIAISYVGGKGAGPLGIGWDVTMPKIRRSQRVGLPKFNDSDELELIGISRGGTLVRDRYDHSKDRPVPHAPT